MARSIRCSLGILFALQCLLTACGATRVPPSPDPKEAAAAPSAASVTATPAADPAQKSQQYVSAVLSQMTPGEKVGQLLVISFRGEDFTPELEHLIQDLRPGGILIFAPNVSSVSRLQTLITQAQGAALVNGAHLPLFVAMDHEGGIISRLGDQATEFPSNMALGASRSLDDVRMMADAVAEELLAVGINMTLGPVLDVNTNPENPVISTRSFGSDTRLVTAMGTAVIQRYQQQDLIAVAKHFPGHGDTSVDSHISLPRIDADRTRLESVELAPFMAAAGVGVDAIMTAHIVVPALDEAEHPATLSARILTGLLREEWGFDGLIATDSLGMGAIEGTSDLSDAALQAFVAGADLLMFGWDSVDMLPEMPAIRDRLLDEVQQDSSTASRLDDAVRRILRLKAERGILDWQPPSAPVSETVRSPAHLRAAEQIAQHSATLVRDENAILPLAPETRMVVVYPNSVQHATEAMERYFENLQWLPVGTNPTESEINRAVLESGGAEVITVLTLNALQSPQQAAMVQSLAQTGKPMVIVALRSPYDLLAFPDQPAYVAIYGETPPSLDAMAQLLCGRIGPRGLLPVELPGLHTFGSGLASFARRPDSP